MKTVLTTLSVCFLRLDLDTHHKNTVIQEMFIYNWCLDYYRKSFHSLQNKQIIIQSEKVGSLMSGDIYTNYWVKLQECMTSSCNGAETGKYNL